MATAWVKGCCRMIWSIGLCGILLVAFTTDLRTRKIPNYLTVSIVLVGFIGHCAANGWGGLLFSLLGAVCGFAITLVLFILRAVGAGDVKLFAAIGACMGAAFAWDTFVYAIIYGGMIAAAIMLFGRERRWKRFGTAIIQFMWLRSAAPLKHVTSNQATFPFMWAVLPAAITAYWGQLWI
ncbi:prepilin peptidase [Paenibacillus sp.]|uniref:prepilin peptidase n=1 Tax=Paenibacillus sp. TaxID=58172 RepID=UPI003464922B